jgi:TfoX/Sxy family transcriptional regulator of competence genes
MPKHSLDAYLKDLVEGLLEELPEVTTRRMFGSDAWFANGSIFTLVWDGRVAVKLTVQERYDALLALPGARPWSPNANKPMSAWLLTPEDFHDDPESLRPFLEAAHQGALARPQAPKRRSRIKSHPRSAPKRTNRHGRRLI